MTSARPMAIAAITTWPPKRPTLRADFQEAVGATSSGFDSLLVMMPTAWLLYDR